MEEVVWCNTIYSTATMMIIVAVMTDTQWFSDSCLQQQNCSGCSTPEWTDTPRNIFVSAHQYNKLKTPIHTQANIYADAVHSSLLPVMLKERKTRKHIHVHIDGLVRYWTVNKYAEINKKNCRVAPFLGHNALLAVRTKGS
ncbi:hypothetical protein ILYODFUR_014197 [Ilyodon furcidens]|uniref:Uncharacterized protein n=1 Tax=Ilyodon furcidens TaxID=33524 RepID=A0ABV0U754_9TELE